jgi:SHS2 domain-containing protein
VTLEETFAAASDAMINVMVTDLDTVKGRESRNFRIEAARQDMLLFGMLQELIYYKDAEQLLLRTKSIRIESQAGGWNALVEAAGERIDPSRHDLIVDVKAVTLYRLRVEQNPHGWSATVVVDV